MSRELSLIPLDSEKIRREAIRELKTTLRKMETSKTHIQGYLKESKPTFLQWYTQEMNSSLSKLSELEKKTAELANIVREVFAYAEFHRIPPTQAYLRIQLRKATPEEDRDFDAFYDEEEPGYWEENFGDGDNSEKQGKNTSESHSSDDEEHEYYDFEDDGFDCDKEGSAGTGGKRKKSASDSRGKKSKDSRPSRYREEIANIFRTIARYLHPDKNPNLTDAEKENWFQALEYYNKKDVNGLKDILTWVRIQKEITGNEVSVSEIHSLNKKFKKDLKGLQKEIRQYKKHPDWDFPKKTAQDRKKMRKEMEEELKEEFIRLHFESEKLRKVIHSWKNYVKAYSPSYHSLLQN